jgi:tetratricopeptide (TPR) repeat protein
LTDIFISYARQDRERVAPLVALLESLELSVWWDRAIKPGDSFEGDIDKAILDAKCVVVVWSKYSIHSQWVRSEALEGMDRNILVPLLLDDVRIPVAFKQIQAANFHNWPEGFDQDQYADFVKSIQGKLERPLSPSVKPEKHLVKSKRFSLGALIAVLVFAGFLTVVVVSHLQQNSSREVNAESANSLAVLRFSYDSPQAKYAADSLTHETNALLRNLEGVSVVNPAYTWQLPADTATADIRFQFDHIVRGAVTSDAEGMNIEVRLENAFAHKETVNTYRLASEDLLAVQQEIVTDILDYLGVELPPSAAASLQQAVSKNPATYRKYLMAQDRLRRGELEDIKAAVNFLQEVTEEDSEFAAGFAALCKAQLAAYRQEKDPEQYAAAERSCQMSLDISNASPELYLALGDLYAAAGQSAKAQNEYFKVLAGETDVANTQIGLGNLYMQDGKIAEAQSAFLKATEAEPEYWRAHNALGSFFLRQGMYYQASQSYQKVVSLAPRNAMVYTNLGAAHFYLGNFEESVKNWEEASQLNKESGAYSNIGFALYLLGRFEEASGYIQKAIDANPNDYRLWGNLGDNLRFLPGRETDAAASYRRAIDLAEANRAINPRDVYVVSRLAVFYAAIGNAQLAQDMLKTAQTMSENDVYVMYDIAVTLDILGKLGAAQQQVEKAIAAGYPATLIEADPQFHAVKGK